MSMDEFASWLEENISFDVDEQEEEKEFYKQEETDMSMDEFATWLETNISFDVDEEAKKEENFIPDLDGEEYIEMPISNMMDHLELFVEEETKSTVDDFNSWLDKLFRKQPGEGEYPEILLL
ncbi:uncharacterized protein LOC129295160 [Prosopis cineraria]|uniref:uncharacterized protein LOC129295160 n=1 Tax=Prosopis cineraria TaxID=364024 RepID=UPI0024103DD3|nr:uncharacterized protein LOC129295160 [Prosopis cineraria]